MAEKRAINNSLKKRMMLSPDRYDTSNKENEEWREVFGYDLKYLISNLGRVRSITKISQRQKNLSPSPSSVWGYLVVGMRRGGKTIPVSVHRLVAEAFIENVGRKPTVNHKNGIKTDNRIDNLEWSTQYEQTIHAIGIGLRKKAPWATITEKQAAQIKMELNEYKDAIPQRTKRDYFISKKLGISEEIVKNIRLGRIWKTA